MKYIDILQKNSSFDDRININKYSITILSNIIVNQIGEILEYNCRINDIPAVVSFGNYNNIVQDSSKLDDTDLVILFWELANIIDCLYFKANIISEVEVLQLEEKVKNEIDIVLNNLKNIPLVLFNRFSSLIFSDTSKHISQYEVLCNRLNKYLEDINYGNIVLIDIDKLIARLGIENSIDLRFFYYFKALYTVDFFDNYSKNILPYIMAVNGVIKKAIIFDCDNTLWKGVIGEDGIDNINISTNDRVGIIFSEVQAIALSLSKQYGVVLGLCSKNNSIDVDKVINEHPDMLIRDENIIIKRVNWNNKVFNLMEISKELNIGLESIVYIDDSEFEIELIRNKLPEITVLQVPKNLYEYPKMLREYSRLFWTFTQTDEDRDKTKIYKQQIQRKLEERSINDIEEYLASLQIKINIILDDNSSVSRISQMTQKTNQFNLTTKRYTESDIAKFVSNKDVKVITISVLDRFGSSGITGLCIITLDRNNQHAEIDSLLMSCRIIGRNIEYAFMDAIIDILKSENIKNVNSSYIKTNKNNQVSEFYDRCGWNRKEYSESFKQYSLSIDDYERSNINYIEINNEF